MLDRTIPYHNMILRCDALQHRRVILPAGYRLGCYQPGMEKAWAQLECGIGDFISDEDAERYFLSRYAQADKPENILFLIDPKQQVVGSCIAWTDLRLGKAVASLHWLVVAEAYQGRGLGRALCCAALNRFYEEGRQPVYIHTQPWSYPAVFLYLSLGFRLQKKDTFAAYQNEYIQAMQALRNILPDEEYQALVRASCEA